MTQIPPLPPAVPPTTSAPSRGLPGWGLALIIVGASLVVLFVIGLLVAILMPSLDRAEALANRTICQANLQTIGAAVDTYVLEHDAFPPDGETLKRSRADLSFYLECPGDTGPGSYCVQFPGGDIDEVDAGTFIACDLKGNHPDLDGGRNVLRRDGSVQWMREEAFQAQLAKPWNAEFAKALRAAEGP
ncbi:MAG TPA: hypothetical protein VFJ30_02055 [Phycisphaerae bacterium]|nr:hypothetical protein [Phycisphaerae bacterium]